MKIGLEIHVQLPTRSKMFCSCPTTDAPAPNTHVCPTCLGMPGSRPVLNKEVLVCGIKLAKMLGCTIADETWFSRKTYFYPDMSKSVQITQYDHPIGVGGVVDLNGKPIRITRIHLEEDPGKTKRTGDMHALVDYNRSGIPLAEIVTEPDLSTPAEARAFLAQLIQDIKHTLDLENGERSIRCDCNISVGKERCEIKNVTGLKNVETALTYEMVRQIKVLKAGGKIERATMNFDESRGVTYGARKKEFEADYGYIDEPDLGIFHIKALADSITIKEAPAKMIVRIANQYEIDQKMAKQLVSARNRERHQVGGRSRDRQLEGPGGTQRQHRRGPRRDRKIRRRRDQRYRVRNPDQMRHDRRIHRGRTGELRGSGDPHQRVPGCQPQGHRGLRKG